MKNRTIIGIICIILSVTIMFGISPIVSNLSAKKIKVIQLKKHLIQGQQIKAEDLEKTEIGGFGVKEIVIKEESLVVGKFAKSDIYPNTNLLPDMLSDSADAAEDVFKSLNGELQAISITISGLANGLSGKLKNGDIISIISISEGKSSIPSKLTYVKVITATTTKGTDSDKLTAKEDGTTDLPATVTLLVNKEQATLLALLEQTGKMHISLVYRGTVENANKFLNEQEKLFQEGKTNG